MRPSDALRLAKAAEVGDAPCAFPPCAFPACAFPACASPACASPPLSPFP
jgi:hypothetical protein